MHSVRRLVIAGGDPQDVFLIRNALRQLGLQFELTLYADETEAQRIDAKKTDVVRINWSSRNSSLPELFTVLRTTLSLPPVR